MDATLLNLPWQVQLSLASGYAAYLVANVGNRAHHQTIDVAFSTLLFGLFATLCYNAMVGSAPVSIYGALLGGMIALVATVTLGGIWRKWGRSIFSQTLRKLGMSFSNDDPSVLSTISSDTDHELSQIAIKLDDGRWLRCDDASLFADSPFGPCLIGPTGDVALYLTHVDGPGDVEKELVSTRDARFGDRLTYVPASHIVQMNVRYKKT